MLLDMHPVLDHSLAVVEVTLFLVAVGKVAVLEDVIAKVASTSVAVVIVASFLEVVDVKETPDLEGVDVIVEVFLTAN